MFRTPGSLASFLNAQDYQPKELQRALKARDSRLVPEWQNGKAALSLVTKYLTDFSGFFSLEPEYVLQELVPYEHVQHQWGTEHGKVLQGLLTERGYSHQHLPKGAGITASVYRWIQATTSPRPQPLHQLLQTLQVDVSVFFELETSSSTLNEFAVKLQAFAKDNGLSQRSLAQLLEVPQGSVAAWSTGRGLPTGEVAERLECILGVSLQDVRDEKDLASTTLEGLTGLGLFLRKSRLERGWTLNAAAERFQTHSGVVRRWETGTIVPQYSSLRAVAHELGITREEMSWVAYGVRERSGETFGQRLERLRVEKLVSSPEMAQALGIAVFVLRRYETDHEWPGYNLQRIEHMATLLETSVWDLLGLGQNNGRFAAFLQDGLEANGHSISDLALATGVSAQEVQAWTLGEDFPPLDLIRTLAGFFHTTCSEIRRHLLT